MQRARLDLPLFALLNLLQHRAVTVATAFLEAFFFLFFCRYENQSADS